MTAADLQLELVTDGLRLIPLSEVGGDWLDENAPSRVRPGSDGAFLLPSAIGRQLAEAAASDGLCFAGANC